MSTLRADAAAKPRDHVRELRVGGHDVVEDQWRGETDSVVQVLLNNQVSLNPGLVVTEAVALAGSDASITVGKPIATLLGVDEYTAVGVAAAAATAWTPDADQVANPGLIAVTGAVAAGWAVVHYIAA